MLSFLKVFLRGLVCTVLLPLIIAVWVLYGVYCLVAFLVMLVKSIILFFAGENAAGDLPEDIEAKKRLLEAEQAQVEQAQMMNMVYQNLTAQQQMMQQVMGQQMPQQPTFPQQQVQQPEQPNNGFDPFIPDPVKEAPLPKSSEGAEPTNEEGGENNGESY